MVEPKTQQRPANAGPQRKKVGAAFKWKNAAAVGVATVAILATGAAFRWCGKKPAPEKTKKKPAVTQPVQLDCQEVSSKPVKDDGKCESDKGEHNPYSDSYDSACGYCGDNKQQSWETIDNCAYDFICDKGNERYYRKTFAKFKPMDDGKLELVTVSVTKRCNPSDKPKRRRRRRPVMATSMVTTMTVEPVMKVVVKRGGPCQSQQNPALSSIESSIRSKIRMRTNTIWGKGVPKEKDSKAVVRLNISNGRVVGISATVRWSGGSKSFSASSLGISSLKGRSIGYSTGPSCYLIVKKSIPSAQ